MWLQYNIVDLPLSIHKSRLKFIKRSPSRAIRPMQSYTAALISVSLALSQTPAYTARPRIQG